MRSKRPAKARARGSSLRQPATERFGFLREHWRLLLLITILFAVTTDDREVGLIADGRQMIFTAVALTETGSLGQARGRDLTAPRPGGDSVSRYGIGMSLAQVPAAFAAPFVEARRGAGASQPLFLIAPWLFVIATAILCGLIAKELGASRRGQALTIALATVASPLGAYAALELSEPLQALSIAGAFLFSLLASRPDRRTSLRFAVAAGSFAGIAVLTKSSLMAAAPLALVPLVLEPAGRRRKLVLACCGAAPIVLLWLYFEITRFGRPFASYAGEAFSHSMLDGLWRLTVGVNKGILWYFPAVVVAFVAIGRRMEKGAADRWLYGAMAAPFIVLLLLAAPWWAWHGVDGWGPRLILPGIPLLAVCAAMNIEKWPLAPRALLVGLSILVNLPPLLQHPTPVVRYMWKCAWPVVDARTANGVPLFARQSAGGGTAIPPDQVLDTVPSASPFLVLPWFFSASSGSAHDVAAKLQAPPWIHARPDIQPAPPFSDSEAASVARVPRWNFWGRGFSPAPAEQLPFTVYDAALEDQILRAQQLRRGDDALRLSDKLMALAPSGFADALLLESYRLLGRRSDAVEWISSLPTSRRKHPAINIVLALWDRDDGKVEEARALLRSSAGAYPRAALQDALTAPLAEWPSDFAGMTDEGTVGVKTP